MQTLSPLILASSSPRRSELLTLAGISFTVRTAEVEESYPPGMDPSQVPSYLARKKAAAASRLCGASDIILAADTVVVAGERILGKPGNTEEARGFLELLSGRSHEVITGVILLQGAREVCFSETTRVFFRELSPGEIGYYVDAFRPLDKAGAYAIQEWIGVRAVERIEGDYYNVVGLPVSRVIAHLETFAS